LVAMEAAVAAADIQPSPRASDEVAGAQPQESEKDRRGSNRDRDADDAGQDRDRDRDRRGKERGRDRREKEKDKDKEKGRRRDERSRSRRRRRDKSRSRSRPDSDAGNEAGPAARPLVVPVAPAERKVRGLGGFDNTPAPENNTKIHNSARPASFPDEPTGGRQVGCRGSWAEFSTPDNRQYYVNIATGEKTWARPLGYDNTASNRGGKGNPSTGHTNLYVGSLPAGINEVSFGQLLTPFGQIMSMKMVPAAYYGFVKYSKKEEAAAAIQTLNGAVVGGVQLQVRFANMDRAW